MKPIQPILSLALLLLVYAYFSRLKSHKIDRLIIALLVAAGIVFVGLPDLTTSIANFFGVGRGTDLLLYFCFVGFSFCLLVLYSKQRRIEQLLTEVLRRIALQNVREPSETAVAAGQRQDADDEGGSHT